MTRSYRLAIATALTLISGGNAFGHEVRPGYLELKQVDPESYRVFWKVPAIGEMRLSINPKLPANCLPTSESLRVETTGFHSERGSFRCAGGIEGREIAINGLASTITDVVVRLVRSDDLVQIVRLTPSSPSFLVEALPGQWEVATTYLKLGVEHILLGVDHLLFVLAMLILVKGWKRLIGTITAFTVAHSITLAAATLGFVYVPGPPIEASIALSIVFVTSEIIHARRGQLGITERWPWVVAFVFGLLHGFGFASALSEVGLPQHAIPVALLFFNLGVELGQLLFIGCVMTAIACVRFIAKGRNLNGSFAGRWLAVPDVIAAYGIGTIAAYWLVERTVSFWV